MLGHPIRRRDRVSEEQSQPEVCHDHAYDGGNDHPQGIFHEPDTKPARYHDVDRVADDKCAHEVRHVEHSEIIRNLVCGGPRFLFDLFDQLIHHGGEDQDRRVVGEQRTRQRSREEEICEQFHAIAARRPRHAPRKEPEKPCLLGDERDDHEADDCENRQREKGERREDGC